tara:strand:- start:187 stop:453 length:267 start_codon:yes stop_codon:yes gene_type:complete
LKYRPKAKFSRLAYEIDGTLFIFYTRQLNDNLRALPSDVRLGNAYCVDSVSNDFYCSFELFVRDLVSWSKHDFNTALQLNSQDRGPTS